MPTVQALNVGDTLTDRFTVTTIDGTAQLVIVTINGANDAAVITGDTTGSLVEASGVANGTPGTEIATGHLNSTDVDNPDDAWNVVGASLRGDNSFGSYTLTSAGVWTYTLDNSNAAVQALNVGQTLTDTFTATTVDGTAQLVTITINGANDVAVISGVANGSVTEAGGVANGTPGIPIATGDLNSTDVDNPSDAWTAVGTATASAKGYGTYTLTAAGLWTYTLDNSNADVQARNVGQILSDTFTVFAIDGTSQVVTITIHGTNDAAVVSGATTGSVVEAGGIANGSPGTPIVTGDLNFTDVDDPNDAWTAVGTPIVSTSGYGSYTLTAAGVWAYTLNNSNAAVQALNVGQILTDTFTVTTVDGTAQLVTITINGANDAAVISGVTNGAVVEAGGVANSTPGTPTATGDLKASDVDNTNNAWLPSPRRRERKRFRQLHSDSGRCLGLYAQQQQSGCAGAQRRRHPHRHVHRRHGRRHPAAGDRHHQRRQRRRRDQRRRQRAGDRGRRRQQRHAGHRRRDREISTPSMATTRAMPGPQSAPRPQAPTATVPTRSPPPGYGTTRSTTAMPRCKPSMSGRS